MTQLTTAFAVGAIAMAGLIATPASAHHHKGKHYATSSQKIIKHDRKVIKVFDRHGHVVKKKVIRKAPKKRFVKRSHSRKLHVKKRHNVRGFRTSVHKPRHVIRKRHHRKFNGHKVRHKSRFQRIRHSVRKSVKRRLFRFSKATAKFARKF